MNEFHFDAEITGSGRAAADLEPISTTADRDVWASARDVLRERVYRTNEGHVRVRAEWRAATERAPMRVALRVVDESGRLQPRDVPAFVELFFHDAFLLFNIAAPGSFGGFITFAAGEVHVNDLTLEPRAFEYAWLAAHRNAWPPIAPLPLAEVAAWYDSLQLGTQQLATNGIARALFHLLHLSMGSESESDAIVRLAQAIETLGALPFSTSGKMERRMYRLFELRDAILRGTAPLIHPMHDDALDGRVDAIAIEWIEAADFAASVVLGAIQAAAAPALAAT